MKHILPILLLLSACKAHHPATIQQTRMQLDTITLSDIATYPVPGARFRRLPDLPELYAVEVDHVQSTVPVLVVNGKRNTIDVTMQHGTGNVVNEAEVTGKSKDRVDNSVNTEQPNSGINISWKVAVPIALFVILLGFAGWRFGWFR